MKIKLRLIKQKFGFPLFHDLFSRSLIYLRVMSAGVNFINILRTKLKYEHLFGSFFHIHVTREKLRKQHMYEKFVCKMLMKLTKGVNFINIFRAHFCTNVLFVAFSRYVLALAPKFCTKNARVNVDEIDGRSLEVENNL